MIISQLSIAPVGVGISLSKYVKEVIKTLKSNNLKYTSNDMATIIETKDLETLFDVVKQAHNAVLSLGAKRVITELKIDDRKDKNIKLGVKKRSIQ